MTPRTLVVVGSGAEDCTDDLGRVIADARTGGRPVLGMDPLTAAASCLDGGIADLVAWATRVHAPCSVIVEEASAGLPDLGPEAPSVPRAVLVEALRLLTCGGAPCAPGSAPPPESTGAGCAALLASWDLAPGATVAAEPPSGERLHPAERAPRVSVLVPVHGHEAYLDATMTSLLAQTHQDFEVVALDDGSRDASRAALERYASDPRVRVLTQENIGWTGRLDLPFNRLVQEARGELLAWLGGDDVSRPDRIETQVAAFDDDPGVDVCHGAAEAIDASGAPLGLVWGLERSYDDASALRAMLAGNLVGHPSVMMRRSAHDRLGGFTDGLVCDYQFWLRAAGHLRFRYLPHRLVGYRQHPASLSTSAVGLPRAAREAQRVRRAALARSSFEQLFPELAGGADPRPRYEALLSLGNDLVPVDPALALAVYDLIEEGAGFEVENNRAVVHAVTGDHDAALVSARAAAVLDPRGAALWGVLTAPTGGGEVTLLAPRAALDGALARARERDGGPRRRWDGTSSAVRSAWVGVDPRRPDVLHLALEVWAELTSAGRPLRWVLPDLGRGEDRVAGEIGEVLGRLGTDLSNAADVVVERTDSLALLPPDPNRATGLLSTPRDVEIFATWVRDASASA